jgi:SAM-dependent methyltransferase
MKDYEPVQSFGADVACEHDHRGDEAEAVAFLAARAGGGPVLELAIGTGRLALPLAARGLRVDGIDLSTDMVDRLREKPGGERLSIRIGDFADVDVPDRYRLVFVAWNSLFNLLSQDDQVRCFENVAARLTDDGVFVVEVFSPAFLHRLPGGQQVAAEAVETDRVRIDVLRHDAATQSIEESHVTLSAEGVRLTPVVQRYAWPSELDLMARIAGLVLRERYAGWTEAPFESDSAAHVSVYARAA